MRRLLIAALTALLGARVVQRVVARAGGRSPRPTGSARADAPRRGGAHPAPEPVGAHAPDPAGANAPGPAPDNTPDPAPDDAPAPPPRRGVVAARTAVVVVMPVALVAAAAFTPPLDVPPASPEDPAPRAAAGPRGATPSAGGSAPAAASGATAESGRADASPASCRPAPLALRAAQTLVAGLRGVTEADDDLVEELGELGVGGILLVDSNVRNARQVRRLIRALRAASSLPLLVAADEETGRVTTFSAFLDRAPSPRQLAARRTPAEVRELAEDLGDSLRDLDVDMTLAPVADLDDGPWDGIIGDRSFSDEPDTAASYVIAFARGLSEAGVLPAVKHFPGHGRSATDSHLRLDVVDTPYREFARTDLVPFVRAIDAGTPVVMTSHVGYEFIDEDLPASLDPRAYELLRSLGFEGVAMTDSVGMGAVNRTWPFPEAAVRAVAAGADAVLVTTGRNAPEMVDALVRAVEDGDLPEARLNEAAARMLALKGVDPEPVTCTTVARPPSMTGPADGVLVGRPR